MDRFNLATLLVAEKLRFAANHAALAMKRRETPQNELPCRNSIDCCRHYSAARRRWSTAATKSSSGETIF